MGLEMDRTQRRARRLLFAAGSLLLVVIGTVVLLSFGGDGASTGFVVLAVGLAMVSSMSVDVAVSDQGVRVRADALHWPHVQLELDEIEAARAIDLRLRLFRRAAGVLRAGPAIELDLTGGRRFAVTVDDTDEAAAVLNGLFARASR